MIAFVGKFIIRGVLAGLAIISTMTLRAAIPEAKGLDPLPAEMQSVQNYGLFLGINKFPKATRRYPELKYAVNDAVAYAYTFCKVLRLIEPKNCFLLISGKPTNADLQSELDELNSLGAQIRSGTLTDINRSLSEIRTNAVNPDGMLVLTLSTHGYLRLKDGSAFAVTEDSTDGNALSSDLDLTEVKSWVKDLTAQKRLLVFDICRNFKSGGERGPAGPALEAGNFLKSFREATGTILVSACDDGEASHEHPEKPHGAFSFYFLDALRGNASADSEGYMTVGTAFSYAAKKLGADLSLRRVFDTQTPRMETSGTSIPLSCKERYSKLQPQITTTRDLLRNAYDPDAEAPLSGRELDQLWLVLGHAPNVATRETLARKANELLGKDTNKRKQFLEWWSTYLRTNQSLVALIPEGGEAAAAPGRTFVATRGSAFFRTNSLGMVFRLIPGTKNVWLSVFETRLAEFSRFQKSTGRGAKSLQNDGNLPAANVTWEDAQSFCDWLTQKEKAAGERGRRYRLPSDHEWSLAVELSERADGLPEELGKEADATYPWTGKKWPPTGDAGNLPGEEREKVESPLLKGYKDAFIGLAPVGSFAPNKSGFYDLTGNVWEWTGDDYNNLHDRKAIRGGAFRFEPGAGQQEQLRSGFRFAAMPGAKSPSIGFRVAMELTVD